MKKILTLVIMFFSLSPVLRADFFDINSTTQAIYFLISLFSLKTSSSASASSAENGEASTIQKKIKALKLPADLKKEVDSELKKLKLSNSGSSEHADALEYLNRIVSIPFGKYTQDNLDLDHAQQILDAEHFGLDEIKDRILDFLAVQSLKATSHAPILCFVGPPGIGKTTFAQSIAHCLGRNSFTLSAGGMHDESEIRGHSRTYRGALPGRFVTALQRAGSMNALIIIDEIDKLGRTSNHGDPSAALLEMLDPNQNTTFFDNYIRAGIDFSKVMFIATANNLEDIPEALRDRMEIIQLSGYTREEKIEIAERHLIKRAIANVGLEGKGFTISRTMIGQIIDNYAPEPGVRKLQRIIEKICSKAVRSFVQGGTKSAFNPEDIAQHLGPQRIEANV